MRHLSKSNQHPVSLILASAGLISLLLLSGISFDFSSFHSKSEARVVASVLPKPSPVICDSVASLSLDSFTNPIETGLSGSMPELATFAVPSGNLRADTPNAAVSMQDFIVCLQGDTNRDIVKVNLTTGDYEFIRCDFFPSSPFFPSGCSSTAKPLFGLKGRGVITTADLGSGCKQHQILDRNKALVTIIVCNNTAGCFVRGSAKTLLSCRFGRGFSINDTSFSRCETMCACR